MITRLYSIQGITTDFDASVPCLFATFEGFSTSQDFRSHCERGLMQVSQKTAEYGKVAWLSDLRKSEVFTDDDVKWVNEYWNIQAYIQGLQYMALVMAESVFAAINLEDYMDEHRRRKDPLIVKLFSDVKSARIWCKEMLEAEMI